MRKVPVKAKEDFIKTIATARPMDALAELIWNGFDAEATKVQVFLELNSLDAVDQITIRDNGYGVDPGKIDEFFGDLGDSWKKQQHRQNGRTLHGKNGKGRFSAFSLGEKVEWRTSFRRDDKTTSYTISGSLNSLENFETSAVKINENVATGTDVVVSNIAREFRSFKSDNASIELAKIFAGYLTEYPGVTLEFDGVRVDPKAAQVHRENFNLGDIVLPDGKKTPVAVTIIEWGFQTAREIHLCDENGISLYNIPANMRAPGFNFTVYVKTPHFRELDKSGSLSLADLQPDVQAILAVAKPKIKEYFRLKVLESKGKVVERWKEEKIYPYEEKSVLDPVELAERQVFDILAVNVQDYLPSFENADIKAKRFTFKLLAQALKDNPDSVQTIIGEVLGLKKEAQNDLAELLKKTTLSSIISSARTVASRMDFLLGLENLLFDRETKKVFLERDQLHKVLDNEAWIFSEEFTLAGSEQRLEEVLNIHLDKLGKREDDPNPVVVGEDSTGRVDLLLHKVVQPRTGEFDYLVVELKRPSQKINQDVLLQVKKYAMAVAKEERFRDAKIKWTFIAISNDMDADARAEATQRNRPKGIAFESDEYNITVWAKTWSDVIGDARARLNFFNEQLSYQADRDSSKVYLNKAHAKFIPDVSVIAGSAPASEPVELEAID